MSKRLVGVSFFSVSSEGSRTLLEVAKGCKESNTERTPQGKIWGLVHTNMFSFDNASFSLRFGFPSTLRWCFCQLRKSFLKSLRVYSQNFKLDDHENSVLGQTEVENQKKLQFHPTPQSKKLSCTGNKAVVTMFWLFVGRNTKMRKYNLVFTKALELSNVLRHLADFCWQINMNFPVQVRWRMKFICIGYIGIVPIQSGLKIGEVKGLVHPKMKIVINYSPSCRSKPVRPLFIFETQIKIFLMKAVLWSFFIPHRKQHNYHIQGPER